MTNRDISNVLSEMGKLMELHGMNEFKVKSVQNAAFNISRIEQEIAGLPPNEIEQLKGVGKSISQKILELISTGTLAELDSLLEATPKGVVEMMRIKGIGPKKVAILWKELGVETPGELLYACNENRLTELKGFGLKTQDQIKKAIEFSISNKGFFHYARVEEQANEILKLLLSFPKVAGASVTGNMRRKCEVITSLDFLIATTDSEQFKSAISSHAAFEKYEKKLFPDKIELITDTEPACIIHICNPGQFAMQLMVTTGNQSHIDELKLTQADKFVGDQSFNSENEIYTALGMDFIQPELREGLGEIQMAKNKSLPELIQLSDLKGCLHNHSTYSDGANTLREMAVACKNSGYQYFGICDHSKAAFYANGLSVERVLSQHKEIELLNAELAPFVIFKGIESDILPDGSLDYDNEILAKFDFIVASVHSVLKMTEQKATERLITAISNPYTTILGHPTGRLLLARAGYPIDHKAVIDACAANNVVIELNAHPYRLDLDWRWIRYAVEKGVMISINPDAHHISGIQDMYFGVCAARKGMLTASHTFNAMPLEKISKWFDDKRSRTKIDVINHPE